MASIAMKNWKQIALANGLDIPVADLDKITPSLDGLEVTFRPLTAQLNEASESALIIRLPGSAQ